MRTQIYRPTPVNLHRMACALRRGDLVGVPSETVYGLAADALNPDACAKIFTAKERPANDPLIIHVHQIAQAKQLAFWNQAAARLADKYWPGPLTLVLPKREIVPNIVTAGLDSVALRMPQHPVFRALLETANLPLAAPSANPFGYISPTTSDHVKTSLKNRIAYILEGGACRIGLESTIVDLRSPAHPQILRPGAITLRDIQAMLTGTSAVHSQDPGEGPALSPGLLKRHYSPNTAIELAEEISSAQVTSNQVFVFYQRIPPRFKTAKFTYVLTPDGTGLSAANRLFALLRKLDAQGLDKIHLQLAPSSEPLAEALNDRMRRAAAR
ncbi:MAG: threonylcarbamoyl-AMP synthase [Candidatus Synoicihabitans palmerolidicus]|nr:threonylcarbamoyl-AMP synthase [Candidatus Synoicihabitans palmerolidicus]